MIRQAGRLVSLQRRVSSTLVDLPAARRPADQPIRRPSANRRAGLGDPGQTEARRLGERPGGGAGVLCLSDRADDDHPAGAPFNHLVKPVERLDPTDREPRPVVLVPEAAACSINSRPAAGRPGLVGVTQVGPAQA